MNSGNSNIIQNNTNKSNVQQYQFIESLLNYTEQCKLVAEVYHLLNGTDDESSKVKIFLALIVNKSSNDMAIMFLKDNKSQQQQQQQQPLQRSRSGSFGMKRRGSFFATASTSSSAGILGNEQQDEEDTSLRITHFFPLKKQDFGLKIDGELQFELIFRKLEQIYCLEAASIGTMWSVISALTNASKELNNQQEVFEEINWHQFYFDKYLSNSPISNSQRLSNGTDDNSGSLTSIMSSSNLTDGLLDRSTEYYNLNPRDREPERVIVTSNSLKEDWIKTQLKAMEDEFTELRELKIVVGTWNVNSKVPKQSLASWLRLDQYEADIYVVGLQEIDMTAGAMIREETEQGTAWCNRFDETFDQATSKYYQLMKRQLVGMLHVVYINERHMSSVSEVHVSSEGVGVLGMMGNKGGVGIRFKLYETTFCFINAHLAPHMDAVARRNQNYHDILRRTNFGHAKYAPEKHDFFFWIGDLNYRVNLPDSEVREYIRRKDFDKILEHDQLIIEHKAGRVFNGMVEGKITFQPTYKFDAGTQNYDTSEKKRIPSYTDRILWMNRDNVKQEYYSMNMEYISSDHKPVVSGFTVGVKVVQQDKYQKCYRDLFKTLDRLENDMLPEIKLSSQGFTFDDIQYETPIVRTLELENTGQVVCEFQFIPKPMEEYYCKKWLQIEPTAGIIIPGEKLEIKLTLCVDSSTASELNFDKDSIDDILILHLKNGRDHFVSLSGNFLKSCFGNSLENLITLGRPVRGNPSSTSGNTIIQQPPYKIPQELWRLVDFIYQRGLKVEGLFKESGSPQEKQIIRQRLDTGEPFDADFYSSTSAAHNFAEVLLSFLEALAEPVMPYRFYKVCIEASASNQACIHIVSKIPPVHFTTFHYLMHFLREFLKYGDSHLVKPDELAIIFSRVLIRPPKNYPAKQAHSVHDQKAKALFVKHFLSSDIEWEEQDLLSASSTATSNNNTGSDTPATKNGSSGSSGEIVSADQLLM